ncbi:hypothetical protein AHiyo1_41990 [Arthrobacter sp. Hiyo1]|nr:hypothetical protein AHiyo1_41990 [Arthrobacter sp. Hiyo1]
MPQYVAVDDEFEDDHVGEPESVADGQVELSGGDRDHGAQGQQRGDGLVAEDGVEVAAGEEGLRQDQGKYREQHHEDHYESVGSEEVGDAALAAGFHLVHVRITPK